MQVEFYFSTAEYKKARGALLSGMSPCDVIDCNGQFCVNCPLSQYFKKQCPNGSTFTAGIEYIRTHIKDGDQFKKDQSLFNEIKTGLEQAIEYEKSSSGKTK